MKMSNIVTYSEKYSKIEDAKDLTTEQINEYSLLFDNYDLEYLEYLLSRGADINLLGDDKYTVLMKALIREEYDAAKFFISKGARPDIYCGDGAPMTPVDYVTNVLTVSEHQFTDSDKTAFSEIFNLMTKKV